eukprot:TRINITY_DN2581_c0_g1_i2.p1 TRINITY_DN2581_c0_g1~~TRINITY_DN2581_c0_g1_i2.p1  ORF type:complete len:771 (-),score=137.77 TRINITY_DN2581_c0_g1_i2:354-2666(-)
MGNDASKAALKRKAQIQKYWERVSTWTDDERLNETYKVFDMYAKNPRAKQLNSLELECYLLELFEVASLKGKFSLDPSEGDINEQMRTRLNQVMHQFLKDVTVVRAPRKASASLMKESLIASTNSLRQQVKDTSPAGSVSPKALLQRKGSANNVGSKKPVKNASMSTSMAEYNKKKEKQAAMSADGTPLVSVDYEKLVRPSEADFVAFAEKYAKKKQVIIGPPNMPFSPEMLVKVFSHLKIEVLFYPTMFVCKEWNVGANKALQTKTAIDCSKKSWWPVNKTMLRLYETCCNLKSLNISYCTELTKGDCFNLTYFPPLSLDDANAPPKPPALIPGTNTFYIIKTLQELYLDELDDLVLTEANIRIISTSFENLRKLSMVHTPLTDQSMLQISRAPFRQQLRELNISHCYRLTDKAMEHVAMNFSNLEMIDISYIVLLSDRGLAQLGRLTSLRELSMVSCIGTSVDGLVYISQALKKLKKLYHGEAKDERAAEIDFPMKKSNKSQITDAGLEALSGNFSGLSTLVIKKSTLVTDLGLQTISEKLQALTVIHLPECRAVSDAGLDFLTSGCPALENLDLSYTSISDEGLQYVGEGLEFLKHLYLNECKRVSDVGIHHIVQGCPDLTTLELRYCPKITNETMKSIAYSPRLAFLDVSWCRSVTDEGIIALSLGPASLSISRLEVEACSELTIESLKALKNFGMLQHLNLTKCWHIDDDALSFFSTKEGKLVAEFFISLKISESGQGNSARYEGTRECLHKLGVSGGLFLCQYL